MTVDAVIFDIGNVLIEWQPERFYDRVIGEDRRRAIFDTVDLHKMNDRVDRGEHFRDVIYETADQYPQIRDDIRMWHDNWIEMASPAIEHSVRLMRALQSKGVPVFALTNFGVESFAYAQTEYDFLNEFDRAYVSGHMKVIKPDADIYAQLEADCGIDPKHLLFTDDRLDNIEAAAARGWQTHLFEGATGWAARLVAEELLSKEAAA
ncbi:2-haloacid dehalogenase [Planktotalea frisia]|jgi:2-haloacid dehalogenase|uniref:Alpha-D-glucose-1-phosphatase n=1 Tax=Planktotalea frisia TaxID=696762 RepID=A0A1L9P1D1_9RHOB|nr:HAD family phosphatase [Planktotalea frisia]OJI95306.1 alpha-D-glucose-1-phosphatase [Planktotalea frisia]PZX32451.1 2-haloacid dehalogenase [Planktotalea frisia]